MNLPDILNVAIGLVVLYFLLSSIASLLIEMLTTRFHYREEILHVMINRLLLAKADQPWKFRTLILNQVARQLPQEGWSAGLWGKLRGRWTKTYAIGDSADTAEGKAVLQNFWNHPKIRCLVPVDADSPPALAAATFALVLVEVTVPKNAQGALPDNRLALERALAMPTTEVPASLRDTLATLARSSDIPPGATADGLWQPFRASIAAWYDEAGAQATQYYRTMMKRFLLCTGLLLALLVNADTVRTIQVLAGNSSLRDATVAYATALTTEKEVQAKNPDQAASLAGTRKALGDDIQRLQKLESIGFPLGWRADEWSGVFYGHKDGETWEAILVAIVAVLFLKVLGLAATGLATAQGGPFWYDLMQKLIGLRKGAGGAGSSDAGATKDQPAAAAVVLAAAGGGAAPAPALPLEIGYDLATPATGFSPRKAYWLACASAAAYSPGSEVEKLVRQSWGFHHFQFFDAAGAQCFFAADENIVLVSFRGTELQDLRDDLADANAKLFKFEGDETRLVHKGFQGYVGLVWDRVQAALAGLPPPQNKSVRQIYLTGHSLGGAMATVMFARLTVANAKGPVPLLYTYGCPRVGNAAFARQLDKLYPERIYRLVNDVDIVPELPPVAMSYQHVGRSLQFMPDGTVQTDLSGLSRVLNRIAEAVRATDLKDAAKEWVVAHGVAHYVALCEKLARQST